ncbi:MAG: hypothetical protein IJW73_00530 [Candidatus Gastranaerophilales bacterium]|nr:hypothetical protein [Candidatus Gastranaerophilales bacterium]
MNVGSIKQAISTNSIKLLSGLGNNDDCLAAMIAKDWIGDAATVYTYKKEGGKDDAREKAIEEFGTGAIWLFGIPLVKKIVDKTVYPFLKLDSNFDPRVLDDKSKLEQITTTLKNSTNEALSSQKEVFSNLFEKNPVIKSLTNAQLYKGMAIGKFAVATIASAIGLTAIIKYKQDTTTKRIEKEIKEKKENNTAATLVMKGVEKNPTYLAFTQSNKKSNPISFTGGLAEFMYNPIKNTMILDGVITGTRLKEARKGERGEVLFKEACQIAFIYGFPKLFDKATGFIGKKLNCPIDLDPKVLFDKGLKEKIDASAHALKQIGDSKNILNTLQEISIDSPIIDLLDKNGVISTIKDKAGKILSIDYFKPIDEDSVKNTVKEIASLGDNFKNLGKIKAFKTSAIIANIIAGAAIMGVIQPLINIWMRKKMNNGDNRNPAIIAQERNAMKA